VAHERDPHGDDRRAAARFRRACKVDPDNPLYRAAFGRAAVRCGKVRAGVRALLAAADHVQDRTAVPVVGMIVDGLLDAGRPAAARQVLARVRFLCPDSRELNALWGRVRFETARRQQVARGTQDAIPATDGGASFLPFVRVVGAGSGRTAVTATIRRDLVSKPRPHFARLRSTKADR
jgi:hypothetical protein